MIKLLGSGTAVGEKQKGDAAQFASSECLHRMPSRWSSPHVSTRFVAPIKTSVHWLNAIRVILLNYYSMIFQNRNCLLDG
jgi:hypothetical protein